MLYQGGNVGLCVVCTRVISQGVPVQYKNRVYCKYYVELSMKLLSKEITIDLYRTFLLLDLRDRTVGPLDPFLGSILDPLRSMSHDPFGHVTPVPTVPGSLCRTWVLPSLRPGTARDNETVTLSSFRTSVASTLK